MSKPVKPKKTEKAAVVVTSFDEGMRQLEQMAQALEREQPLEEAISLYADAMELCKMLHESLDAAEKRVQILSGGEVREDDALV